MPECVMCQKEIAGTPKVVVKKAKSGQRFFRNYHPACFKKKADWRKRQRWNVGYPLGGYR